MAAGSGDVGEDGRVADVLAALELPDAAPGGARLSWDYGLETPTPLSAVSRWRMRPSVDTADSTPRPPLSVA